MLYFLFSLEILFQNSIRYASKMKKLINYVPTFFWLHCSCSGYIGQSAERRVINWIEITRVSRTIIIINK